MSNQRLFGLGLVGLTAFAMYVLTKSTQLVLGLVGVPDTELFGGFGLSHIIGSVLGVAAGVAAWMNPRVQEVGQDTAAELLRVTWPNWAEIKASTVAVLAFSGVAAVILGLFDLLASKVMIEWIPIGIRWAQGLFA